MSGKLDQQQMHPISPDNVVSRFQACRESEFPSGMQSRGTMPQIGSLVRESHGYMKGTHSSQETS